MSPREPEIRFAGAAREARRSCTVAGVRAWKTDARAAKDARWRAWPPEIPGYLFWNIDQELRVTLGAMR